jgi:site-specific DNA-methyltransferase (adenine-specific)
VAESNTLYYGDNLDILRQHIAAESVDLVYLDPPFNSNATYNVLFAEQNGSRAAAQIKAFGDTWRWDDAAARAFQAVVETGGRPAQALLAFRQFLGETDMLAYLSMMAPRLVELRRVLKPNGNIYLHCDPTASHYLKMLMDAVFGYNRYINEIIWHYFNKIQGNIHHFPENHDTIFWYSKGADFRFNVQKEQREKTQRQLKRIWDGETKRLVNAKGEDGHCIYIETNERRVDDVWRLSMLQPASREMLGYPTQKPEALLDRIVQASSNKGDTVLDPFCGCGTAIASSQRLGRKWIGIDITHLAITLIKHRLAAAWSHYPASQRPKYNVIGEPVSPPDAQVLAETDPYQFQWWALGLVGARPTEGKKGADKGIDGRLYFHDEGPEGKTKQVIFSVKAGKTDVSHVRDLRGVLDREKAQLGVLLTMHEPTKPMRTETASGGFYESYGKQYPCLQILTICDLLEGKRVQMPEWHEQRTFKAAPKAKRQSKEKQTEFFDDESG